MGVSVSILSVVTILQVIARFIFNNPIPWGQDIIRLSFASINVTSDDTIDSYQKKIFTSLQANGEKLKSQLKEPTFDCVFDTYFK